MSSSDARTPGTFSVAVPKPDVDDYLELDSEEIDISGSPSLSPEVAPPRVQVFPQYYDDGDFLPFDGDPEYLD